MPQEKNEITAIRHGNRKGLIGISGGSGFVGIHLAACLKKKGYDVLLFSREKGTSSAYWNYEKEEIDTDALSQLDALIHLAGAGIADKRWTVQRKKEILDSRVKGTRFLVAQLKAHAPNCKTVIAASALGIYGPDRTDSIPFKESASAYNDFLGNVCRQWEEEAQLANDAFRTVVFRFGIVLGKDGGAYPKFASPLRFGIMPILGSGRQIISWVYIEDLCNMICLALENGKLKGVYNAVAPNPVSQKELMQTIAAKKSGIHIPMPVPAFALKIGLGEMSNELLKSCIASSEKIEGAGFRFQYGTIKEAVMSLVGR